MPYQPCPVHRQGADSGQARPVLVPFWLETDNHHARHSMRLMPKPVQISAQVAEAGLKLSSLRNNLSNRDRLANNNYRSHHFVASLIPRLIASSKLFQGQLSLASRTSLLPSRPQTRSPTGAGLSGFPQMKSIFALLLFGWT